MIVSISLEMLEDDVEVEEAGTGVSLCRHPSENDLDLSHVSKLTLHVPLSISDERKKVKSIEEREKISTHVLCYQENSKRRISKNNDSPPPFFINYA